MPMQYVEKWIRKGYHTDSIDCLSFSPDGTVVTSSGMDGNIVFTDSTSGKILHAIRCHTPVLSLKWVVAGKTSELWAGFQSGKLLHVVLTQVCIRPRRYVNFC